MLENSHKRPQLFLRGLALSVAVMTGLSGSLAQAGEPEFPLTQEFAKICDASGYKYKTAEKRFVDEGWSDAADEMHAPLKPDFFLNKVTSYETYEVDLDDGGAWYGVNAKGKLSRVKVNYCSFVVVAEDISGLRQDVETYIERAAPTIIDVEGETRYVYAEDTDDEVYFVQEGQSDETTYVFIVAKVMDARR